MKKTALITGCSSGFGLASVKHFLAQGWQVVASLRRPDDCPELADLACNELLIVCIDVQEQGSIDSALNAALARFGQIDVLVNNAGFGLFGIFESTPQAKIFEQFDVNVFGVMRMTHALLPHFREKGQGTIVNVSSGAGVFALPMLSLYTASKFALEGFSESLSFELAALGIQVKIVEPGGVTSTRFGERSAGEAEQQLQNVPAQYLSFVQKTVCQFDGLRQERGRATSEDVAKVIFEACTDGTDRLRYLATQDIRTWVDARRKQGEDGYLGMMRETFAFGLGD